MPRKDFILMLDLETTGHESEDEIVEIGLVLMDGDTGDTVDELSLVVQPSGAGMARIMENDLVREMHRTSGLLDDLNKGRGLSSIAAADGYVVNWLDRYLKGDTEHLPYGGSGVAHFDRRYIKKYMPLLDARITHWAYDVGVVRRMFQYSGIPPMKNTGKTHRALDDARVHANEFRGYISLFMRRMGRVKA